MTDCSGRNRRIIISDYTLAGTTGGTRTIAQHIQFLSDFGWEPALMASRITAERRDELQCEIIQVPSLRLGGVVKRASHAWFASRLARKRNPALVWGHGNLLEQDILSLHNCLHLTSERVTGKRSGSSHAKMHDRLLRRRDSFQHVIANSRLMQDDLVSRYAIDPSRITVIYPGYDPATFGNDSRWPDAFAGARSALGLSPSDFVILFATSGAYEKRGVGNFLDGLALFVQSLAAHELGSRPPAALMIGKADEVHLQRQVRARGLVPYVRYLATVDNIEQYYRAADVLVHSAALEEFGQVIQEAAVCGCPVIASRWVGATELMGPHLGDYVMKEPTPEAIVERLNMVFRNRREAIRDQWNEQLSPEMKSNTWEHNSRLSHELCLAVLQKKCPEAQVSLSSTSY